MWTFLYCTVIVLILISSYLLKNIVKDNFFPLVISLACLFSLFYKATSYLIPATKTVPYNPSGSFYFYSLLLSLLCFPFIEFLRPKQTSESPTPLFTPLKISLLVLLSIISAILHYYHIQPNSSIPNWYPMIPWLAMLLILFFYKSSKFFPLTFEPVNLGIINLTVPFFKDQTNQQAQNKELSLPQCYTLLFYLILFCIPLYLINLTVFPTDVHGDTGEVAFWGKQLVAECKWNFFLPGWFGIPNMFFLPPGIMMWIFGNNLFGIRMQGVLFGLASIPLCYMAFSNLYKPSIAITSTFLMASSTMFIQFSRMGIGYNQTIFFYLLVFLFLVKGIKNNNLNYLAYSSAFSVIAFCSYQANKLLFPLILVTIVLSGLYRLLPVKRCFIALLVVIATFVLVGSPLIVQYYNSPATSVSRFQYLSTMSENGLNQIKHEHKTESAMTAYYEQAKASLLAPICKADNSPFLKNDLYGGMLSYTNAVLWMVGLILCLMSIYRFESAVILLWTASIMFAASFMTVSAPQYQRMIGIIPFLAIACSYSLSSYFSFLNNFFVSKTAKTTLIILTLMTSFAFSYDNYFNKIMSQPQFTDDSTRVARYLQSVADTHYIYFCGLPHYGINYGNIRFLVQNKRFTDVADLTRIASNLPHTRGPVTFVLIRSNMRHIDSLRSAFPRGKEVTHTNILGQDPFITYEVNF